MMWQDKGFIKDDQTDIKESMQELKFLMQHLREKYEMLTDEELHQQQAPGKWSKKQVLGHLIDSAINNLKRFTDAQLLEQPYMIVSYKQDGLMQVNHYQDLPLHHLLDLWQSLNQQVLYVVESMDEEKLAYKVQPQYNQTGMQTLAWLICDYVAHMKHHAAAMLFIE